MKKLFAMVIAGAALVGCGSSNKCNDFCQHVYGDCKFGSLTVDQCKSSCNSGSSSTGSSGTSCKNSDAYEECLVNASCADINSTDLQSNAFITCSSKC